jgi:hypothetical protein
MIARGTILLCLFCASGLAGAQQAGVAGFSGCVYDPQNRIVCAPALGGIMENSRGQLVCGRGQCLADAFGNISCSSEPGGYAIRDVLGAIRCTGGCEPATAERCGAPK